MLKRISKFYGEFKDGKPILDRPEIFKAWAKSQTGRFEITVGKESEDVTQQQWGYLFACIYKPLADELGWLVEEVDGVFCKLYLTQNKGTKKEYVKSKSRLSREEIAQYMDLCIMKAAEMGVVCQPPNKNWRI